MSEGPEPIGSSFILHPSSFRYALRCSLSQIPVAVVWRGDWAESRHDSSAKRDPERADRSCIPLLWPTRMRENVHCPITSQGAHLSIVRRPNPGALRDLL